MNMIPTSLFFSHLTGPRLLRVALPAACVAAAGFAMPVFAEPSPMIDPGAIQERDIERRRKEELRRVPDNAPVLPGAATGAKKAKHRDAELSFSLKRVAFDKSRVFTPEEFAAIARAYEGRTVKFSELEKMLHQIDAQYARKGHPIFHAVIPPQKIKEGVLQIRLVEATFEKAEAKGNVHVRSGFVTAHIHQEPGELLDVEGLQRDLLLLKRGQELDVQADLLPGKEFGSSDVIVNVYEDEKPWMVRLFTDNFGSCSTGEYRVGVYGAYRNMLGFRDDVWVQSTKSEGDINFGGGVRFPINTWGGRAGVSFIQDETKIVNGDFASLNITGRSRLYATDATQPVYATEALFVSATGGAKVRQSLSRTSGILTSDVALYGGQAGMSVDLLPLPRVFARFTADYARGVSEAENVRTAAGTQRGGRQEYQCIHLAGYASYAFSDSADIRLSSSATLAVDDAGLPSAEQFALGGDGSLRGYCTGTVAGDSGWQASVEFRRRLGLWYIFDEPTTLVASFFYDAGAVNPYAQVLQGTGAGLEAQFSSNISARISYARGLVKTPAQTDGYDRVYFMLSLQY